MEEIKNKLIDLAVDGDISGIKDLVTRHTIPVEHWDSVLAYASHFGHLELVKYSVEQGASIVADNYVAVRWAAMRGRLEVIQFLEQQGLDIYDPKINLMGWSASHGHLELIVYLEQRGVDIDMNLGEALSVSVQNEYYEVSDYLITRGANIKLAMTKAQQNGWENALCYLLVKQEQKVLNNSLSVETSGIKTKKRI